MTTTVVEPGSVGTPERREPKPVGEHEGLIDNLFGPHEWGYRCPVEGGFIADNRPYEAATTIRTQAAELERLRGALEVIGNASELSETMFGGKMSDVTRVFEHITRVARLARALSDTPPEKNGTQNDQ